MGAYSLTVFFDPKNVLEPSMKKRKLTVLSILLIAIQGIALPIHAADNGDIIGPARALLLLYSVDCNGVKHGPATIDPCGVCDEDPTNDCSRTSYSGDTTAGNTWDRPYTVGTGEPSSCSISTQGPVHYNRQGFFVEETGTYTIDASWTTAAYDGYLHLYEETFTPQDQCLDLIAQDDDYNGATSSQIAAITLTAGVQYYVIASGFNATDFGTYDISITGDSTITLGYITRYNGDTTSAATWDRPDTLGTGESGTCGISSLGPVKYTPQAFHVESSGTYTINASWQFFFDGYLHLYATSFNPTTQCVNLIALNDDHPDSLYSQIANASLTEGIQYYIIANGYNASSFGSYDITISGGAPIVLDTLP